MGSPGELALEHHTASVKDVRLHYVRAGRGDPVVLLHGWAPDLGGNRGSGGVIERCGHWIGEERPEFVAERLGEFFSENDHGDGGER